MSGLCFYHGMLCIWPMPRGFTPLPRLGLAAAAAAAAASPKDCCFYLISGENYTPRTLKVWVIQSYDRCVKRMHELYFFGLHPLIFRIL